MLLFEIELFIRIKMDLTLINLQVLICHKTPKKIRVEKIASVELFNFCL